MKRRLSILGLTVVFAAVSAIPAAAYYHFVYYLGSGEAPAKFDLTALPNKTVWFFVSEAGPTAYSANDSFSSVLGPIRQAVQVWNGVSSSDLRVAFGGFENANTQQNTPAADVVFEDLAPGLLGYGGPTITGTPVIPAAGSPWVPISRSAIHLNINETIAPGPSYDESFFMTVVHEMGHALGLQHTFTSATMSTATTRATSLMNPIDVDDIAGISVLYPNASFAQTGSITGRITSAGSGVHLESVVAIQEGAGAVSALTNPDGTYEIDGIPPGPYFVYAHALPPDADIKGPWNPDGSIAPASGPTNALFYPETTNIENATPVYVSSGSTAAGINIDLTSLATLPMYDVAVYGYYDNNTIAVKPAYLNLLGESTVVAASGVGLGTAGLTAGFMGLSAILPSDGVLPYQASGNTYLAMDVQFSPFSSTGPQHLIINTPGFMHVVPAAVRLTQQNPPTIQSVTANPDETLTITGTNWATGSAIYFDGLPASVVSMSVAATTDAGTAIVMPPPGTGGLTAILTVYNPNGENSQFEQAAAPATYTYGPAAAQTIASISPASLPAGAEAMVDITGTGFNFVTGQTSVGFGTSDIVVRRVFVLGPDHLQADVSVAQGAALSVSDVSAFSGFQMATVTAGFRIAAAVNGLPAPIPILTNALPGLTGSYAGAIVSLYGSNLAAPNATPVLTLNGEAVTILYSSATQINLQIPSDAATGPALMQLYNGAVNAYPVTVGIDTQPATIVGIQNTAGNSINTLFPAEQGDLLTVSLSGFAPDGSAIALSRVQAGVGAQSGSSVMHPAVTVVQPSPGIYQVSFFLNQNDPTGQSESLIVYLDGRSSYPATIPITTPAGSFTALASSSAGN